MDELRIPDSAIGCVGMIAMLRRVGPERAGRLVAVRLPVGFVSNLGTPRAVFAWQVVVLGEPLAVDGRRCREIVVADRCLDPVSEVAPQVIEQVVAAGLYADFEQAAANVRSLFADRPMSEDDLDRMTERAAEQALIAYALEERMTPLALADLGFTPSAKRAGTLQWSGVHRGTELRVLAGPDMFGLWILVGHCRTPDTLMWDERRVRAREARGRVALTVLGLWRTAFGDKAPVPESLQLGVHYERHEADLRAANIGLPTLLVDGEVLRATRRWLARDFGALPDDIGPLPDEALSLSLRDGLLRLAVGNHVYGCPAQGTWAGDCTVSLRTFLGVPPWLLRGGWIRLERTLDSLAIQWFSLPIADAAQAEGAG